MKSHLKKNYQCRDDVTCDGVVILNGNFLPFPNVNLFALHDQCFPRAYDKNFTGIMGGIRTHNLLLTGADIFISSTTKLAGVEWLIQILYSSRYYNK